MVQNTEQYVHSTQEPAVGMLPPAGGRRVTARTFLAPLLFMLLHHAVLNGISLARTFSYLYSNPSLQAELRESAADSAVMLRILVESGAMIYASLLGMVILIPVYTFYLYRRRKRLDLSVPFERVTWVQSLSSVALILGALGLTQLWMAILASFDPASALGRLFADYMEKMVLFDAASSVSALDFIATVLLVPVGEELLFRGIVQGELRKAFPASVSVVGTTLLFALFHLDLIQGSYVLIAGFALTMAYHLTRNIAIPIAMHAIFNFIGSGWLVRLTGAGERAEEIIVYVLYAFVLIGLAGMLVLRKTSRKRDEAAV
ncbi:MAG: CPBP family intramembrane metalloprotease [Clostridiaceae bacterium]|nr:CPBP family intramembrane metalloprotease [Clostridiaceae bacterium]